MRVAADGTKTKRLSVCCLPYNFLVLARFADEGTGAAVAITFCSERWAEQGTICSPLLLEANIVALAGLAAPTTARFFRNSLHVLGRSIEVAHGT
jgi:hypothetical protein